MGTYWRVSVAGTTTEDRQTRTEMLRQGIEAELTAVNQAMSTYIPDSELMRWNRQQSVAAVEISPELRHVVAAGLRIAAESGGLYDITVSPLVNAWGFGPEKVAHAPDEAQLAQALALVGYEKLHLDEDGLSKAQPEMAIDLSSIAKGYGVDRVAQYLSAQGEENFIIDIGGEVRMQGSKFGQPWRIGVEIPDSARRGVNRVISVKDRTLAVATSGNYRNFAELDGLRVVHTLNPKTGKSVESSLLSVTVLHHDCMNADAYATALLALGDAQAPAFADAQGLAALFIFAGDKPGEYDVRSSKRYQDVLQGENP